MVARNAKDPGSSPGRGLIFSLNLFLQFFSLVHKGDRQYLGMI